MTENPYIKQFPDLFAGKTILYVHGFGSSGQSGTVVRLRTVFPQARVVAPDLPIHPSEALALLRDTCLQEQPDLIIGTSMGGMFAEQLAGYDRILVNPAFCIADTMQSHGLTGKQQFFSPREDGVQEFYVDKPLVKEYRLTTEQNFAHAQDEGEQGRVFALFGDKDDLVNTRDLFAAHYPQAIAFHGEHRMNDHSFMHSVVPVMRWIDDRQEQRERPIIYIGNETLFQKDRQPRPSVQKAVRMLIEDYQVYFVGEEDATAWLQEYIGVPAWRHTILTPRRDLLYGDYLISQQKEGDTMASLLEYGSDDFKTWDDVMTFFERIKGS